MYAKHISYQNKNEYKLYFSKYIKKKIIILFLIQIIVTLTFRKFWNNYILYTIMYTEITRNKLKNI